MIKKRNQCIEIQSLFLDSFHGNLPKDQREFLESHLQDCRTCRDEFNRQTELFEVLEIAKPEPNLSEDFWDGYWDRLQEKAAEKPNVTAPTSSSGFLPRRILYSAAAILLLVLGVVVGRYWFPASVYLPAPQAASADSIYPVAQQHFDTLSPILLDYSNHAGNNGGSGYLIDSPNDTEILKTLLLQNRLLKRMASRSSNPALIELLEDLEIVIIEMLNSNGEAGDAVAGVGQLIKDNDLLFKMKLYNRKAKNIRQMPI